MYIQVRVCWSSPFPSVECVLTSLARIIFCKAVGVVECPKMVLAWLAGQSLMALPCLYSLVSSVAQTGLELTEIFQPYLWGAEIIAIPCCTRLSSSGTRVGI